MSLTGPATILLSAALTVLAVVVTARCWARAGRWRLPARVAGLLAVEVLLAVTAGLVVNRSERFYPTWRALGGHGPAAAIAAPAPAGRLDGALKPGIAVTWSPPEAAEWRLSGPPTLIAPADYRTAGGYAFPVVVILASAGRAAAARAQASAAAGVLTVVAVPTPDTTAAALATLPGRLTRDTRAADTGWAIVADPAHTALARRWQDRVPARFGTVTGSFPTAADHLPAALTPPLRLPS